jgi:tRNA-specific 2-thiouridylase
MYVTEIRPESNTVVLGREEQLSRNGMWVYKLNLQKYASLTKPHEYDIKIRYKDAGMKGIVHPVGERLKVYFNSKVNAIAPGQSAVFYEGNDVIGGGIIKSGFEIE